MEITHQVAAVQVLHRVLVPMQAVTEAPAEAEVQFPAIPVHPDRQVPVPVRDRVDQVAEEV